MTSTHRSRPVLVGATTLLAALSAATLTFSLPPGPAVGSEARAVSSPVDDMPVPVLITPKEVPRDSDVAEPTVPPETPLKPVLVGKPPASVVGKQQLVRGFPSVIPVAGGSSIVTSTVTSSAGIVQATLEATSKSSCTQVETFYQGRFADTGLASAPLDAVARANSVSFVRGDDSATLTLKPQSDGTCRYSVFSVLKTLG